jgi:hypothetical protein
MAGFKHPCRYCDKLVPPDAQTCPLCGKVNPVGPLRCPKCRAPIEQEWAACCACGLKLQTVCPACAKSTFFGDYCAACGARLVVVCPNPKCRFEQPPVGNVCAKCGKPL